LIVSELNLLNAFNLGSDIPLINDLAKFKQWHDYCKGILAKIIKF
jgi:hypothetical protein